jgi:lipid II:glycine glycyltransferase (peptidoglycan interpeptide bridge formation enzyme)
MHAERVWVLPLTSEVLHKTDDELLASMRKTTRYLIRKAQRDGVTIEKRTDEKAVDDFWKIYQETAKREKFVPFSKKFIVDEFEAFNKSGNAVFLFGKVNGMGVRVSKTSEVLPNESSFLTSEVKNGQNLASALIIFTKSTAFYHQGASIHSKIPVPYLLQWEAIKEAKKRGCSLYNFWGILQKGRTPKNWEGLTLFKTGFGGRQVDFVPTQDFIISKKYYLTQLYEKFLGWRRGV